MTNTFNFLLNHLYAAVIVFAVSASTASLFTKSAAWRVAAGIAGVLACFFIPILGRSLFEWAASAVERPSAPGLLLLVVLAISVTTGRHVETSAEFRFGTLMLALAGLVLYPASVGFLDYDTYALGYSGYLLPIAIALILAYTVYRGYLLTALALNVAIGLFLASAGLSFNLWDYVMDPVAWIIATGTWIAIAVNFLVTRVNAAKMLARA
jgi:hypothetical protein